MLVLARIFEAAGFSTILVTMMPSWAEDYSVPRVAAVEFPFAHPFGMINDQDMQLRVIRDALRILEQASGPDTVIHLEHVWPGDYNEWRRAWQPTKASPLITKYLSEIRAMRTPRQPS